jgi:hypothetical protein
MAYTDFMRSIGTLKAQPASWRDFYFPVIHGENGS